MHLEHVGLFKLKDKEQGQWKIISRTSEGFQFDGISGNFHVYGTLSIGLNFDAYDLTKQKNTENFDNYNHFVPSPCGMPFTGEFQLHKAGEVYLILNCALMKFLISETLSYALKENFPVLITDFT